MAADSKVSAPPEKSKKAHVQTEPSGLTVSITVQPFSTDEMREFRSALRELVALALNGDEPPSSPEGEE